MFRFVRTLVLIRAYMDEPMNTHASLKKDMLTWQAETTRTEENNSV
jgi:hypothetical protein